MAAIAVPTAVVFNRDAQRERARADALAQRLAELEPIERAGSIEAARAIDRVTNIPPAAPDLAVERTDPPPTPSSSSNEPPKEPKRVHRGSSRARAQVDRLRAALVDGTPLQEYQIRALITAIDAVHSEIDREKNAQAREGATLTIDWEAERNERIVQAAADILFESQFETFMALVKTRGDATR